MEELLGEGDEVPCGLLVCGELVAAQHEDGGFHRLCDEGCAAFFELGVQGVAFGGEAGGVRGPLGGGGLGDAALLAFEGGLRSEVAVSLGERQALVVGELVALFAGVGDPYTDHDECGGGGADECDAEAPDGSGDVVEGYAVKDDRETCKDQRGC
jgi:hypothetical protein